MDTAAEAAVLPHHIELAAAGIHRDVRDAAADVGTRPQRHAVVGVDVSRNRIVGEFVKWLAQERV